MSNSAPNTIFSGSAGPGGDRPGPDSAINRTIMYVIAFVFFPVAIVVHLAWQALFYYARMKWWVPSVVFGVFLVLGVVTGNLTAETLLAYADPWRELFQGERSVSVGGVAGLLAAQMWLGFLLGTAYSAVASAWKWHRRPAWQERHIRPGLFLNRRAKKTAEEIAEGTHSPRHGVTLGVALDTRDDRFAGGKPGEKYGNRVVMLDEEISSHVFIVGASGSGKTSTMLIGMRDVIRMGRGVVVIDCKGGADVPEQLAEWAQRYGRTFRHWLIQNPREEYNGPADSPAYYDPIARGDASRRKDLLIGSYRWDVEYYKNIVAEYIQTAFQVMTLVPLPSTDTFSDLASLLNVEALLHRAKNIPAYKYPQLTEALSMYGQMDDQARSGLYAMYTKLRELNASTAGNWLKYDTENDNNIDLRRAADEGEVVVFSLDTSEYAEVGTMMAGLIVQDLKTVSSELRHNPSAEPLHVYIDEFSAVDVTNILGLLSKSRDAKMPVTISTQALADLTRKEPTFLDQVLGIISCVIAHRANTENDARIFAGLSGVRRKVLERTGIEQTSSIMGSLGAAANVGVAYLEERDEYAVGVGDFQGLKQGECVYIAKSPRARYVYPVQVVRENQQLARIKHDPGVPVSYRHMERLSKEESEETYLHPLVEKMQQDLEKENRKKKTGNEHTSNDPVSVPGTSMPEEVPLYKLPVNSNPNHPFAEETESGFVPPYAGLEPKTMLFTPDSPPPEPPVETFTETSNDEAEETSTEEEEVSQTPKRPRPKAPMRPQRPISSSQPKPANAPLPPVGGQRPPRPNTSPRGGDQYFWGGQ